MKKFIEIPDCYRPKEPSLVTPSSQTPKHTLYLSNLDEQRFLRFSIKYLYLYRRLVEVESLKSSLSSVLDEYYPLAGRLRATDDDADRLELDCNAEGALFAEAFLSISAEEFLQASQRPNRSWRKLIYRVDTQSFVDIPPLVIQVMSFSIVMIRMIYRLGCGGMILCTAISHCVCDGIGTAQFLQAWAHLTTSTSSEAPLPKSFPFHGRYMLKPRAPPRISCTHPEFPLQSGTAAAIMAPSREREHHELAPVSVTFSSSRILTLKRERTCTSFEALAAHVWRSWAVALGLPPSLRVKLLFSVDARRRVNPPLPEGFYGNGFVLACAEAAVERLVGSEEAIDLVREAKDSVGEERVRSVIDLLEERKGAKPDLSASLVISQWAKLGLENLDFGGGMPLHMGPLSSEIYCVFLPVLGDFHAFTVLVSVPEAIAHNFEKCLNDC